MIVLAVQIRIFLLSIIIGWIYGICYSFLLVIFMKRKITLFRILIEIVFQFVFHSTVFYLLYILNNGTFRLYYALLFIIGIIAYYKLYYPYVLPLYCKVIDCVKVHIKRIFLVFSRYISIIMKVSKRKRRLHNDTSTN
ncbi:MAG: spore cortex biosynthesis protein YabQ [Erysipelotrichaceae bacterium]|nr:spore cortex biosynthesis protein YabQ [Erysipelotrichaceae bacterium]